MFGGELFACRENCSCSGKINHVRGRIDPSGREINLVLGELSCVGEICSFLRENCKMSG